LESLSVNDSTLGNFRNFSSLLGLESFRIKFTSVDHEFKIVLMRFDQAVINVSLWVGEPAASKQLRVLFIVFTEGQEVINISNFTEVRTDRI
jgi:hypothetical protein